MKAPRIVLLVCLALAFAVGVAGAHHSFAAVYDSSRMVTVRGIVTEFRLVNPHAMMLMDVSDESGTVTKWTVEFDGRLNLTEGGWTERSIQPGQVVTVTGNPTHVTSPRIFFLRLVRADGSQLIRPSDERSSAIDEQRRQRARERVEKQ